MKIGLIINFLLNFTFYITVIIYFASDSKDHQKWRDNYGDYMYFFVFIILLFLLFPVIHSGLTLYVWRKRSLVLKRANSLISRESMNDSEYSDYKV